MTSSPAASSNAGSTEPDSARETVRRRRRRLRFEALWILGVVATALVAFAWQWNLPQPRTGTSDSFWYARSAAEFAGSPTSRATTDAGRLYCANLDRAHALGTVPSHCTRYADADVSPRYAAIFSSRPGFPLAAAPLVAWLGLADGMLAATAAFLVLGAATMYAALRASFVRRPGAVLGAALVCVLPSGYWGSRMLAEGAAQAGLLLGVLGAVFMLRTPGPTAGRLRRVGPGVLFGLACAFVYLTKPASAAALCVALLAVCVPHLLARRVPSRSRARWRRVAAVAGVVAVGWWIVSGALGLPTLTETVQDMATRHFRSPDISDPLPYLAHRAVSLWVHLPRWGGLPRPILPVLLACVLLLLRGRGPGRVWTATALSAVLVVTAHPLASEYPRLIAPVWIAVSAAAGVLLDRALAAIRALQTRRSAILLAPMVLAGRMLSSPLGTALRQRGASHP